MHTLNSYIFQQFFERANVVMERLAGLKNKLSAKEPTAIEGDRIKEHIGYVKVLNDHYACLK